MMESLLTLISRAICNIFEGFPAAAGHETDPAAQAVPMPVCVLDFDIATSVHAGIDSVMHVFGNKGALLECLPALATLRAPVSTGPGARNIIAIDL